MEDFKWQELARAMGEVVLRAPPPKVGARYLEGGGRDWRIAAALVARVCSSCHRGLDSCLCKGELNGKR